jgi:hypothetical protein
MMHYSTLNRVETADIVPIYMLKYVVSRDIMKLPIYQSATSKFMLCNAFAFTDTSKSPAVSPC